eukprot:5121241-Amphidinium_carterae.1
MEDAGVGDEAAHASAETPKQKAQEAILEDFSTRPPTNKWPLAAAIHGKQQPNLPRQLALAVRVGLVVCPNISMIQASACLQETVARTKKETEQLIRSASSSDAP